MSTSSPQTHTSPKSAQKGTPVQHVLQTDGLVCPFPLVEAKDAMKNLNAGDELVINFDCTQATEAIPLWAAENGYPVTNFDRVTDASWTITVQKA